MIQGVFPSHNTKTGPIAVTYRAGRRSVFGTCPASCPFRGRGCGCYAARWRVWRVWERVQTRSQEIPDAELLRTWVRTLPAGTRLRHHVAGDILDEETQRVDRAYLGAIRRSVPRRGWAWTYTHVHTLRPSEEGEAVMNLSFEDPRAASQALSAGHDVVLVVDEVKAVRRLPCGVLVVHCPAETSADFDCARCGGAQGPLCARRARGYAIAFRRK